MFMKLIYKTYDNGRIVIWLFLAQYLVILLIPIMAMFFVYKSTVNAVTSELAENNYMLLDKSKSAVEQDLSTINMAFQQIENDPTVLNFKSISSPFEGSNVIKVNSLMKRLDNYRLCDNLIYDYYVVFDGNGAVISPYSSSTLNDFYDICFSYPSVSRDTWYREWLSDCRNRYMTFLPAAKVTHFRQTGLMVTVIKPVKYCKQYEGITVVMLLSDSQLKNQLGSVYTEKQAQSSVFIVDGNGGIITTTSAGKTGKDYSSAVRNNYKGFSEGRGDKRISVDGQEMLLTYTAPNDLGWRYVSVQPLGITFAKASYIKKIIFVIVIADLLAGLFVISLLMRVNGQPARRLLIMAVRSQQHVEKPGIRFFEVIQDAFSNLSTKYDDVSSKLQYQKSFLCLSFFDRLFSGGLKSPDEADILMANCGIDIRARYYTVALLCVNGYEEIVTDEEFDMLNQKMLNMKAGLSYLPDANKSLYFHEIERDKVALLILGGYCTHEERNEEICRVLKCVQEIIAQINDVDASLYVGVTCDSIMKVPLSLETARQCASFDRSEKGSGNIVWYDEIGDAFTGYYYPRAMETRIVNSVLGGNKTETLEILDEIYEENQKKRHMPIGMVRLLIYELYGTLLRIMDNGNMGKNHSFFKRIYSEMEEIGQPAYRDNMLRRLKDVYADACSMILQNKNESDIVQNVIEYLKKHYMEADLSLTGLTDKFKISQAYLSKQFKDATNYTVYEYLEKIRIEKACALLSEGNLPVKKIAEKVGYVSSNTFCRAFKRKSGVRAGDYREMGM
jgi:two-component system, response regulator YesN